MQKNTTQKGYLILEILISLALLGLIAVTIVPTLSFLIKRSVRSRYDTQASLYLQEGLEVAYNVFSDDWNAVGTGTYYTTLDTSVVGAEHWALSSVAPPPLEGRFTRTVEVDIVCRDVAAGERQNPVSGTCQGTDIEDTTSKSVITKVEWDEDGNLKTINAELLMLTL